MPKRFDSILNDRHLNVFRSVCSKCKHFNVFEYTCPAFPGGIPDELLEGKLKHDIPLKDQEGKTIFKQR